MKVWLASLQQLSNFGTIRTVGMGSGSRSVTLLAGGDSLALWVLGCGFFISDVGSADTTQPNERTTVHQKHTHGRGLTPKLIWRDDR